MSPSDPKPHDAAQSFVFADPEGRRRAVLRWALPSLALLATVAAVAFVRSLLVTPTLSQPDELTLLRREIRAAATTEQYRRHPSQERLWEKFMGRNPAPTATARPKKTAPAPASTENTPKYKVGFLPVWDPMGIESFADHAELLTHAVAERFVVGDTPGEWSEHEVPEATAVLTDKKTPWLALLSNLEGVTWHPERIESLARADEATRSRFAETLADRIVEIGAAGVTLDWQSLDPAQSSSIARVIGDLARALHSRQLLLWLCIPVGHEMKAFDIVQLAGSVDCFIAQLHDENAEKDEPGPVASQDWFDGWMRVILAHAPPEKWIVSLGAYGYDWPASGGRAEMLGFNDIMARGHAATATGCFMPDPFLNPSFSYTEGGRLRTIWFLDAVTFLNQLRACVAEGVAGVAVYQLGMEDPALWNMWPLADGALAQPQLAPLSSITPSDAVAHVGEGEFVTPRIQEAAGRRTVWLDNQGRAVALYDAFASNATLFHHGRGAPDEVAITFDDGPDPDYTPQILDTLKLHGVKGSFFIVGEKAEKHPDLLRRIYDEGHEIGNHSYTHPHFGKISIRRAHLELNATQRLIESITGRSTVLFRPPFCGDDKPRKIDDLRPMQTAESLGYVTVLDDVDPQDWAKPGADAILGRVKAARQTGNVLLLHDAGGDRQQTVEVLPGILRWLHERGDRVVPLRTLLGSSQDEIMPPIPLSEPAMNRWIAGAGFTTGRIFHELLWSLMIVSSALIVLRTALVTGAALWHRRTVRLPLTPLTYAPVSVVMAAYNEEKVLATTLEHILASDYRGPLEIIVIDDGSTDGTAAILDRAAASDSRIKPIHQPNRGKSWALETGAHQSTGEIIVFLDADTQFEPATLSRLIAPFDDPRVGGVSGRICVGNRRTWIARFQDLEYTCGFNLDRRAYDIWNCITVLPGACSAIRRKALEEIGNFDHDTLAEDTDLTLALHDSGWRIRHAPDAVAWTEAPETARSLARQRFRWSYGTMQCLWKHRPLLFSRRNVALGWLSLPGVWFFQIGLAAVASIVDLAVIFSLLGGGTVHMFPYLLASLGAEWVLACIACAMEGKPVRQAWLVLPARIIYRPLLCIVVWRVIFHALSGRRAKWNKLERLAAVIRHA